MQSYLVPIFAIVGAFSFLIAKHYFRYKTASQQQVSQDGELKREIQELKSRIAALEAIVTEPSYQLRKDIDQL